MEALYHQTNKWVWEAQGLRGEVRYSVGAAGVGVIFEKAEGTGGAPRWRQRGSHGNRDEDETSPPPPATIVSAIAFVQSSALHAAWIW